MKAKKKTEKLLNHLPESTKTFVPLPNSILQLQKPTASLTLIPLTPGVCPDISDVDAPQFVSIGRESPVQRIYAIF